MAKVDNRAGDHLFILFTDEGVLLKGFDHESILSRHNREDFQPWPGIYKRVPPQLLILLNDPSFRKKDVTLCMWRLKQDDEWHKTTIIDPPASYGETYDQDGQSFLLGRLCYSRGILGLGSILLQSKASIGSDQSGIS